ncbi:MAG: hypothetical protein P1P77_16355, partial [Spirochaetaceae bacterium]|nr:hypothetical protein [Spirochaetaceae bacterium]
MVLRRAFLRFLTGYILLLLIPLLSGVAITQRLVDEYEDKVVASRIGQLEQARDIISRYVEDLEWRIYRIAGNTSLQRYLLDGAESERVNRLILKDIIEDLNSKLLYDSSLVSVFYVHVFQDDMILTPSSVYSGEDFVDDKTFFRMEGVTAADWHRTVRERYHSGRFYPVRLVTLEDFKNKAMIPYVRSLPLVHKESDGPPPGAVVYFIGDDEFSGLLAHLDLPDGGYVYIADENNRILTSRHAKT